MNEFDKKDSLDYILEIATTRGISQRKLIEGIYDYSHFNKMCNGKEAISLDVIVACCEKLDVTFEHVITHCKLIDDNSYENLKSRFEYIKLTQQFELLNNLLNQIEVRKNDTLKFQQLFYAIRATIESAIHNNHLYSLDLYEKALKSTILSFSLKDYNIQDMNIDEIGILYNISSEYNRLGYKEKSKVMLEEIVDWHRQVPINSKVLYKCCYELSKIYLNFKKYSEAVLILEWAIKLGKQTGNYIGFGYLYYNLSIANSYLDQVEESLDNFNQSISIFKIQDRPETYIEKLKKDYEMERKH